MGDGAQDVLAFFIVVARPSPREIVPTPFVASMSSNRRRASDQRPYSAIEGIDAFRAHTPGFFCKPGIAGAMIHPNRELLLSDEIVALDRALRSVTRKCGTMQRLFSSL